MRLDKLVEQHKALAALVVGIAGGSFWLVTTFATVSYVDRSLAETKEGQSALLLDIKERLTRIEDILIRRDNDESGKRKRN